MLKTFRPWGNYTVIEEKEGFKVKRLEVHPGGCLSLQSHEFRSEHWVVVKGTAEVINDNQKMTLIENQSTFIPKGAKHRLSNASNTDMLIIIEVQVGAYLGEDDIERYHDIYNRTIKEYEKQ